LKEKQIQRHERAAIWMADVERERFITGYLSGTSDYATT
jgi:hypothetical protein